jgi:hypothetical protein
MVFMKIRKKSGRVADFIFCDLAVITSLRSKKLPGTGLA